MGLFFKREEECSVCHNNQGVKKIADGYVCNECLEQCGRFKPGSLKSCGAARISAAIETNRVNEERLAVYTPVKKIERYFDCDESKGYFRLGYMKNTVFHISDIISYEITENGNALAQNVSDGKKGREIWQMGIQMTTKIDSVPLVFISLMNGGKIKTGGLLYNSYRASALQIITALDVMKNNFANKENGHAGGDSPADKLRKYKQLVTDGIITEEEFEQKKKQLLGI